MNSYLNLPVTQKSEHMQREASRNILTAIVAQCFSSTPKCFCARKLKIGKGNKRKERLSVMKKRGKKTPGC